MMHQEIQQTLQQLQMYQANLFQQFQHQQYGAQPIAQPFGQVQVSMLGQPQIYVGNQQNPPQQYSQQQAQIDNQNHLMPPAPNSKAQQQSSSMESGFSPKNLSIPKISRGLTHHPQGSQINVINDGNVLAATTTQLEGMQINKGPLLKSLTSQQQKQNALNLMHRRQSFKNLTKNGTDRSQITGISNLSYLDDQIMPSNSIISAKNTQFKANPMNPQKRPPFINRLELQAMEDEQQAIQNENLQYQVPPDQYQINMGQSPSMSGFISILQKDQTTLQDQREKPQAFSLNESSHLPSSNQAPKLHNNQQRNSVGDVEFLNRIISMQQITNAPHIQKRKSQKIGSQLGIQIINNSQNPQYISSPEADFLRDSQQTIPDQEQINQIHPQPEFTSGGMLGGAGQYTQTIPVPSEISAITKPNTGTSQPRDNSGASNAGEQMVNGNTQQIQNQPTNSGGTNIQNNPTGANIINQAIGGERQQQTGQDKAGPLAASNPFTDNNEEIESEQFSSSSDERSSSGSEGSESEESSEEEDSNQQNRLTVKTKNKQRKTAKKVGKRGGIADEVIVEDDEYDGISYLPTPQFINDKVQSSQGGLDHQLSGTTSVNRPNKDSNRLHSGNSRASSNLKIPKQKRGKGAKKGDSDIDGELMSKASKGNKPGAQGIYMDEVSGGQINKQWMDDLDNFLLDDEGQFEQNEEPRNSIHSRHAKNKHKQSSNSRPSSNRKIPNSNNMISPSSKRNENLERSKSNPNTNRSKKISSRSKKHQKQSNNQNKQSSGQSNFENPRPINPLKLHGRDKKTPKADTSDADASPALRHDKSMSTQKFDDLENLTPEQVIEKKLKLKQDIGDDIHNLVDEKQEQNTELQPLNQLSVGQSKKQSARKISARKVSARKCSARKKRIKDINDSDYGDEEEEAKDQVQNLLSKSSGSSSDSDFNLIRSQTPNIQIISVQPKLTNDLKRRKSVQMSIQGKPLVKADTNRSKGRHSRRKSKVSSRNNNQEKNNDKSKADETQVKQNNESTLNLNKTIKQEPEKPQQSNNESKDESKQADQPKDNDKSDQPNKQKELQQQQDQNKEKDKQSIELAVEKPLEKQDQQKQEPKIEKQLNENKIDTQETENIKQLGEKELQTPSKEDAAGKTSEIKIDGGKKEPVIQEEQVTEKKAKENEDTVKKLRTEQKDIDISLASGTVMETPSKSPQKQNPLDTSLKTSLKQSQQTFLSPPIGSTPSQQKNELNSSAKGSNLGQIMEQSNENEGTADAEKKSLIGQTIKELNSGRHQTPSYLQNSMKQEKSLLEPPKRQMTTNTDEYQPIRQESKQTLLSGLTSQNKGRSKFGSESDFSYANNLQNKLSNSKFNSNYLAAPNRMQMTDALSKHTLGQTYEISEDIHMSHSNDLSNKMITVNSNQLTQKAKEFSVQHIKSAQVSNTQNTNTDEKAQTDDMQTNEQKDDQIISKDAVTQPIKELKESRNSSSEKKSDSKENKKKSSKEELITTVQETKDVKNQTQNASNLKQSILQNTLSIQQQISQYEQSSSMNKRSQESPEKLSSISSTGIIQQTERPERFIARDNLGQDTICNQQQKSKSYQKDEVLHQIINLQQNQEKIYPEKAAIMQKKHTTISGYYKDSEGYYQDQSVLNAADVKGKDKLQYYLPSKANATFKRKESQFRSMYSSVSTRSLQPSMNSAQLSQNVKFISHQKIRKGQKYSKMDSIIKNQLNENDAKKEYFRNTRKLQKKLIANVNRKFDIIFANKFNGHKQYLNKKIGAIQQNFLHLKQRGLIVEASDYDDIIEYTQRVTQNVVKAVKEGVFMNYQINNQKIPNLMELEDNFLFGNENQPEMWDKTISSSREVNDQFNEESILKTSENNTGGNQISGNRQVPSSVHMPLPPSQFQSQQQYQEQNQLYSVQANITQNHQNGEQTTYVNITLPNSSIMNSQPRISPQRWSVAEQAFQTFSPITHGKIRSSVSQKRTTGSRKVQIAKRDLSNKKKKKGKSVSPAKPQDLEELREMQKQQILRTKLMYIENRLRLRRIELKKQAVHRLESKEKEQQALKHKIITEAIQSQKEIRKAQAAERIQKMNECRKQKQDQWKKLKEDQKNIAENKPLFQKLQEIHQKKQEKEKRNLEKIINDRKQLFKPMIQGELEEFAQQVDMIVSHLNQKKKEEREYKRDQELANVQVDNYIKSELYQKVAEDESTRRNLLTNEIQLKKDLYFKKKQYAKYIKLAHLPSIDDKKKSELQDRINQLKHPVKQAVKVPPGTVVKVLKRHTSLNAINQSSQSAGAANFNAFGQNQDIQSQIGVLNDQNGGGAQLNSSQSSLNLQRNRNVQPSMQSIQNQSQIQQASKMNQLSLPPIAKAVNRSTIDHPKKWNQQQPRNSQLQMFKMKTKDRLQTINENQTHSFLRASHNTSLVKNRLKNTSSLEPKVNSLAHIEKYEENKFLRERVSKSQSKARNYLLEMRQSREQKSQRKAGIQKINNQFNSSLNNSSKSLNARSNSLYNQDVFATMRKNELSALEKLQLLADHQKDLEIKHSVSQS